MVGSAYISADEACAPEIDEAEKYVRSSVTGRKSYTLWILMGSTQASEKQISYWADN